MSSDSFTFHRLEAEKDVEQDLEIMRRVFGQDTGVDLLVKKLIYNHPKMTLKNHFVIKHCDRIVATLNLIPVDWSIGDVPLKVAEMGNVATLEEYRHHGLIRRLVNEYHKEIADQGYDLSVIEGIPYFYRQFGYEYTLPLDEETKTPLERLPDHRSELAIRPFTSGDIPKAMHLLQQAQKKFYVHTVRDEQIWKMQHETGTAGEYSFEGYAVEENGEMVAYFRISRRPEDKQLILREATDTDHTASRAILKFLKDTGKKSGLETLVARTSYHDLLTKHLVTMGAEQRIPPYAWQIRVTDDAGMFQKMKPLLETRLATSEFNHLTEKLSFNFRRYIVQMIIENGLILDVLRLDRSEPCIIGLNPPASTQLLLGYRSREELETIFPDFYVRSERKKLIDVLFPKLPSYIHAAY